MTNAEKIAAYAYRYWAKHRMEDWPTVRRVARALKLRFQTIEEEAGELFNIEGYNWQDVSIGDLKVYSLLPEVDIAWCGYWLPYSGGKCICGTHLERKAACGDVDL